MLKDSISSNWVKISWHYKGRWVKWWLGWRNREGVSLFIHEATPSLCSSGLCFLDARAVHNSHVRSVVYLFLGLRSTQFMHILVVFHFYFYFFLEGA
jgi:hypothetical protein